jgi:hypothetical protein
MGIVEMKKISHSHQKCMEQTKNDHTRIIAVTNIEKLNMIFKQPKCEIGNELLDLSANEYSLYDSGHSGR